MSRLELTEFYAGPKRLPATPVIRDFCGDWQRWTATERVVGAILGLFVLAAPLMRLFNDLALH